ncbi:MAG: hypothetical protein H7Y33_11480 [Cytophagales bacterium]|nr:hypothetical protein [Rhizobacter sp.]
MAHRVGTNADASQIADAIGAVWHDLDLALSPVLGRRGVAALYKRSLHLNLAAYPWLAQMHEGVDSALAIDVAPLHAMLAIQSDADAAETGAALIHTFTELLATLIGDSLSERLLDSVWDLQSAGGPPAQDTLP